MENAERQTRLCSGRIVANNIMQVCEAVKWQIMISGYDVIVLATMLCSEIVSCTDFPDPATKHSITTWCQHARCRAMDVSFYRIHFSDSCAILQQVMLLGEISVLDVLDGF